tara:strand:- start:51 stop:1175 length:1125 start_codon:yes stop_codon:yes gene_type:complete
MSYNYENNKDNLVNNKDNLVNNKDSSIAKKVLITGVTGQDGSNMIDFLLKNTNHKIYGTIRSLSNPNHDNINEFKNEDRLKLLNMDLTDGCSITNTISNLKPDYFINFAAQSFVGESWNQPITTFMTNSISVIHILEAIRIYCPKCRFYSAGSSEEFGDVEIVPQTLTHPLKPRSPYGASKCAARHIVKVYRESYNLFAVHCVLFNHEGIKRGKQFVTRKITSNLARIKKEIESGDKKPINFKLGNIYAKRDWSDSEDFVEAVWLMLNRDIPKEYLLSSNSEHSVKDFVDLSCKYLELDVKWLIDEQNPINTKLVLKNNNHPIIAISEEFYRPAEVDILVGNSKSTWEELNWEPKTTFEKLIKKMIDHDYKNLI